jgi:hypothetical protein
MKVDADNQNHLAWNTLPRWRSSSGGALHIFSPFQTTKEFGHSGSQFKADHA